MYMSVSLYRVKVYGIEEGMSRKKRRKDNMKHAITISVIYVQLLLVFILILSVY